MSVKTYLLKLVYKNPIYYLYTLINLKYRVMKSLFVKCSDGFEYRVVEIRGGGITSLERDGVYYIVDEDLIVGTTVFIK